MADDFDSFMQSRSHGGAAPPPSDFDSFMASRGPQAATTTPPVVRPPLDGLPSPTEAAQAANLNAQQTADMLTNIGAQMHADALSKIPHALRGYTPQELAQPTGRIVGMAAHEQTVGDTLMEERSPLYAPVPGAQRIAEGVEQIAGGPQRADSPATPPGPPGYMGIPSVDMSDNTAAGLGKIVGGGLQASTPLLLAGGLLAPIPTAAGVIGGTLAQEGTEAGLKKVGVSDAKAELAGDAAGVIAGGLAAHSAGKFGPRAAVDPDQVLNPEQAPTNRRLEGDVTTPEPPAAGKQPVNSPNQAAGTGQSSASVDTFMRERQSEAQPRKPSPASTATVDVTPETIPTTKAGSTNDNRSSISVERGVEPQGANQAQSESGGEAAVAPQNGATAGEQRVDGEPQPGGGNETEKGLAPGEPGSSALAPRPPQTAPAYGNPVDVKVPGEATVYSGRYAVREREDIQASHNSWNFDKNPDYEYENDRDYSNPQNAARVVTNSAPGTYDPEFTTTASPTAEQGAPVIDPRGNVLGGNNRSMVMARVYARNKAGAAAYVAQLAKNAPQFGIDPDELGRFKNPVLVRELNGQPSPDEAQRAITDFNKTAAAKLAPEEQAVADGRRLSAQTVNKIQGNLADGGQDSTLAESLRGDNGAEIIQSLVKDGVLTEQEKNGYLFDGKLTPEAKGRIGKALVGRLFDTASDYAATAPELRNKLEQIAPQVLRVEDRPEWNVTQPVREALGAVADAKAHGLKNIDDLNRQTGLDGKTKNYSPEALAIAKTFQRGPVAARQAFRQYANDAELSRDGAQVQFFDPPTQKDAFAAAFQGAERPLQMQASRHGADEDGQPLFNRSQVVAIPQPAGAPEVYKTARADSYHIAKATAQELTLPAADSAHAVAVVVNGSGMELLNRMSQGPRDEGGTRVGASHLTAANAAGLARNIDRILGAIQSRPAALLELRRVAELAASQNKSLAVVKYRPANPDGMQLALREELNHARQALLGPVLQHLGAHQALVTASKYGATAMRALSSTAGYIFDSVKRPGEAGAEIGVRLMVPGRHGELGLTPQEARVLAAHYVTALRREYGHAEARPIAKTIFEALRRTDRRSANESGGLSERPGSGGRRGPPASPGQDLRAGDAAVRADAQTFPTGTGLSRGDLHAPRTGPDRVVTGEPRSLFSDSENADVAATAASDRAKLEGQRLTAQMKAPVTRAEQLKKLKRSKAESQTDLFGGDQGGPPPQGTLFNRDNGSGHLPLEPDAEHYSGAPSDAERIQAGRQRLRKTGSLFNWGKPKTSSGAPIEEEDEGKLNYSGMGAAEDAVARNLSQLRRAAVEQAKSGPQVAVKDKAGNILHKGSPAQVKKWLDEQAKNPALKTGNWKVSEIHDPWSSTVEAAAWKSQAAVALHLAVPRIEKAMQGDWKMQDLQRGLIESNLIGKRERWEKMADFATRASDENLTASLPRQIPILDVLQDRMGLPRNLADTATALAQNKDFDGLRQFLAEQYGHAAERVASIMPRAEFDAMSQSPTMSAGRQIYKDQVEAPMARAHAMNEGMFQDATGPWKTYYPLTPVTDEDAAQAKLGTTRGYASPSNKANHFATGLSQAYDDSMEALRGKLMTAVRDGTKAAALDALEGNSMLTRLDPFEKAPAQVVYAGQAYNAVKLEIASPRTIVEDGKVTKIPATYGVIPEPFEKELRPVFEKERFTKNHALALLQKINSVSIAGPADALFHSINLGATTAWNAPFLLPALVSRAYTQGFGQIANEFRKMINTDSLSEDNAPAMMRLARIGALSDRFGSETYSKKYAAQMGSERHLTSGPWLYGPRGVDVRGRIFMHNLATALNPGISDHDLHMWVNQLGTYSTPLQSTIVRWLKKTGIGPFSEAGIRMNVNGVNSITGRGPMPLGGAKGEALRWYRLLTTGAIAAVAAWILQQKAYTGKYPWEDKRSRLFEIPLNHDDRYSKLGRARWGNGPETGYVKTTFWNPLVARGARALGIKGFVDTKLEGGTNWQALEAAEKGILNTWAHPSLGPIPRALIVGLTGDEPYLTGLRDDRAQYNPQLMPAVKNPGGSGGALKRPLAAARELNPMIFDVGNAGVTSMEHFFGNTAYHSGIGNKSTKGDEWMRMLTDYALPGVLGEAQNPAKTTAFLKRQARAAERQK